MVFVDSYFYLAILNPRDTGHAAAIEFSVGRTGPMTTTEWVLTEVADGFSRVYWRERFLNLYDSLLGSPDVTIVSATPELFARGISLYRSRLDKAWPLTDCLSFVVMGDLGISEALTADSHFRQAGFTPLLET